MIACGYELNLTDFKKEFGYFGQVPTGKVKVHRFYGRMPAKFCLKSDDYQLSKWMKAKQANAFKDEANLKLVKWMENKSETEVCEITLSKFYFGPIVFGEFRDQDGLFRGVLSNPLNKDVSKELKKISLYTAIEMKPRKVLAKPLIFVEPRHTEFKPIKYGNDDWMDDWGYDYY